MQLHFFLIWNTAMWLVGKFCFKPQVGKYRGSGLHRKQPGPRHRLCSDAPVGRQLAGKCL